MALDKAKIVEDLSNATVIEIAELVKELESKWGVSAAAPVAAAAAAAPGAAAAPAAAPEPAAPPAAPADPRETYFQEIYEEFVQVKMACGESTDKFPFDKFAAKLRKNTAALMGKPGVTDVQFSVYIKDGKAALKASPIKS